ncbi:hypothetical protein CBL_01714 [Carabus blaptoides fortunei]
MANSWMRECVTSVPQPGRVSYHDSFMEMRLHCGCNECALQWYNSGYGMRCSFVRSVRTNVAQVFATNRDNITYFIRLAVPAAIVCFKLHTRIEMKNRRKIMYAYISVVCVAVNGYKARLL